MINKYFHVSQHCIDTDQYKIFEFECKNYYMEGYLISTVNFDTIENVYPYSIMLTESPKK